MIDPDHFASLQAERDRLIAEVAWLRALIDRLTGGAGPGPAGVGAKLPPTLPPSPYGGGSVSGTVGTIVPGAWTFHADRPQHL
jgi:hypothetical protein